MTGRRHPAGTGGAPPARRRARLLRGYGPPLAAATAFLVVSALTGPADRGLLALRAGAGAPTPAGPGPGSGATASGSAASGAPEMASPRLSTSASPATPTSSRAAAHLASPADGNADVPGGEPVGAVTPCVDRTRQIPNDPYSPPCLAFSGFNGGATHRGVTDTAVRIGIRFPADPVDFARAYELLGDYGIHETREDVERTAFGLIDYFNANYQFYGRKLEPVIWSGSGLAFQEIIGGGQDGANADAIKAATELNVFADASAFTPPYADALVRQKIVAIGAPYMSRRWYSERAPYAWSITPDCSLMAETTGEVYVKQLAGRPAEYAGGALANQRRRMALVGPDVPWYQDCIDDGMRRIEEGGADKPLRLSYSLDFASFTSQAASIVAKLKDEGITSVACACDPFLPLFLTAKANEQNYEPEWLVLGTALTDTDFIGQFYDPRQWKRAFGISLLGPQQPVRASLGYRAYKSVRKDEPSIAVDLLYYFVSMLAIGVQMAGPDLNPETFQQGMFNYPRASGPAGNWGFGPGDFTPMDDAMVIWWDPEVTSPYNNKAGAYRSDFKRYRPGEWPTEKIAVFR